MIKFAERVNRISASPTLAVMMAAKEYQARGIDVVDFGPGEPDFPTPDYIKRAAVAALSRSEDDVEALVDRALAMDPTSGWACPSR